jgi:Fe-Mn family superoxide dismutase
MDKVSRRTFINSTAAIAVSLALESKALAAQEKFSLAPLGYGFAALEPAIDAETMSIHHGKHHQSYINNLNAVVEKDLLLQSKSLEQLNKDALNLPEAVRNNAGGHYNHSFFWKLMISVKESAASSASADLIKSINRDFGSLDLMKKALNDAASQRFGSGWGWIILDKQSKLQAISTPNQDNPLMKGMPIEGKPILAIDVWEHAYYLKYRNKRVDYLNNWWSVVNWKQVSENYSQAL